METSLADSVVDDLQDQSNCRPPGSLAALNYQRLCKERQTAQAAAQGKQLIG